MGTHNRFEDWGDREEQPLYFDLAPAPLAHDDETHLLARLDQSQLQPGRKDDAAAWPQVVVSPSSGWLLQFS
jgi:hypothetical protein